MRRKVVCILLSASLLGFPCFPSSVQGNSASLEEKHFESAKETILKDLAKSAGIDESFWSRHKGKVIGTAVGAGILVGAAAIVLSGGAAAPIVAGVACKIGVGTTTAVVGSAAVVTVTVLGTAAYIDFLREHPNPARILTEIGKQIDEQRELLLREAPTLSELYERMADVATGVIESHMNQHGNYSPTPTESE